MQSLMPLKKRCWRNENLGQTHGTSLHCAVENSQTDGGRRDKKAERNQDAGAREISCSMLAWTAMEDSLLLSRERERDSHRV